MIIALTGSSGSLGTEITSFLKGLGHQIITISSSIPGDGISNFSYEELQLNLIKEPVDIFIHLASLNASLNNKNFDREVELAKNVVSSLTFLQCKKIIFFSTAKVYGDNKFSQQIFLESSPLNPVCSYGKAKLVCEELILRHAKNLGISSIIFRLPPVLNEFDNSNLGRLMRFSKLGIPMLSLTHGDFNKRSFLSFINIEKVLLAILGNPSLIKNNETYNLADNDSISLNHLLRVHSKRHIVTLPKILSRLLIKIPILKNILVKLYGNFLLDNSKLQKAMGVKLNTTEQSLTVIRK